MIGCIGDLIGAIGAAITILCMIGIVVCMVVTAYDDWKFERLEWNCRKAKFDAMARADRDLMKREEERDRIERERLGNSGS